MRGFGRKSSANFAIRSQVVRSRWLDAYLVHPGRTDVVASGAREIEALLMTIWAPVAHSVALRLAAFSRLMAWHASDETFRLPLCPKRGIGRARIWHGGLQRAPQCPKAVPQGRGGARLLSISARTDASLARSPFRKESRIRGRVPIGISGNG